MNATIIIMKALIIILVVVRFCAVLVGCAACPLTQTGPTTCVNGCADCNNGHCNSCCPGYSPLANDCIVIACSDPNCNSCTKTSATQTCSQCSGNLAPSVSNPANCLSCNINSDYNCGTVNNCSSSSICVTCNRYSLNDANVCQVCSSNYRECETCNNNRCLKCVINYALNVSSGYKECVPCNFPMCSSCNDGPVCASCISGYYVSNNTCLPCVMPCTACSSATVCSACDSSQQLYYIVSSACQVCSATLMGCRTCGNISNFTCYSCLNGYYFSSGSCTACVSPCLTCTSAAICTSCVNATYVVDGYYTCVPCSDMVSNCDICNSTTVCISCLDGYYTSANTCLSCSTLFIGCFTCDSTKCFTCLNGSQIQSDFTCSASNCTSPCLTCVTNQTTCKSCIVGHYLSGTACPSCDPSCKACLNGSYCLTCAPELEYNNGVCTACLAGQNYNPFSMLCEVCPSFCLTCEWWTGCLSCSPLFEITSATGVNRCTDICGDTYAVDAPCDNTLGIVNDGCTDQCQVEADFNCTKTLNIFVIGGVSQSINTSQCSYIGNVAISIVSAQQSIFTNTLNLGFKIHPYLNGMPTNADTQSYLQSIFQLSPLNTLSTISISVDANTQIVTFIIDHPVDISTANFSLTVNFAYLAGGSNAMFKYMSNVTYSSTVGQIVSNGRLGEYQQSSDLQMSKLIYGWSAAIGVCALCIMIFGTLGKELAGLDQAVLCQHVFMLLMFYQGKLNLQLTALSGLKFSTGLHFTDSLMALNQAQSYNLQLDSSSFLYNCNFNLIAYILPLALSFVVLLYKLRNKHLPSRRDLAQQTYQVLMGETILYLVIFNFTGMVAFSYLFYTYSHSSNNYYDNAAIFIAVVFTIFAFFNFFAKPEIVGMFRSAFRTESEERDIRRPKWLQRYAGCIEKRCFEETLKRFYSAITINFYLAYLIYLFTFVFVVVVAPFNPMPIVLALQVVMMLIVLLVRPHFNILQKSRAMLTWVITLIGTITVYTHLQSFILPVIFLALLTLHMLVAILIIISSLWQQLKRKCNDRSQVVKNMMKEGQIEVEKNALKELILRFQKLEHKNYSIDQEVHKIQLGYEQELNMRTHSPQRKEKETEKEMEKPRSNDKQKGQLMDEQLVQFQEQIIHEQHQHFRYQKGLDFFDKYNGNIDNDLIKVQYPRIQ